MWDGRRVLDAKDPLGNWVSERGDFVALGRCQAMDAGAHSFDDFAFLAFQLFVSTNID